MSFMRYAYVDGIAYLLLLAGALNWGFWGFFGVDVIARYFSGNTAMVSRVIYALIGIAALYDIGGWKASSIGGAPLPPENLRVEWSRACSRW